MSPCQTRPTSGFKPKPQGPRPNPSPPEVVAWAFSPNPRPNPSPIVLLCSIMSVQVKFQICTIYALTILKHVSSIQKNMSSLPFSSPWFVHLFDSTLVYWTRLTYFKNVRGVNGQI
ncbi:hypothetical protein HanRHA438_Chr14g0650951 [Helianthus annuus]|nr:hypothetical protein HanRHA438_Chr14g0650951 [Helianthus annuus]